MLMLTAGFVWNFGKINNEYRNYHTYERQGTLGVELVRLSLQVRQDEKDFLLYQDKRYLQDHDRTSDRLLKNITDFLDQTDEGELADSLISLKNKFSNYLGQFSTLVSGVTRLGTTDETGLRGSLKQSGDRAEEALDETNLPEIQVAFLKMRKFEKSYILDSQAVNQRWYKIHLRTVKKGIPRANISKERKEKVLELVGKYEQSFSEYVTLREEVATASARLDEIYQSMVPDFQAVSEYARDGLVEAAVAYEMALTRFAVVMGLVALAALGIYLFFSMPLSHSLTRPIRIITETMMSLARGERDVTIDIPAQNNEIGQMVAAIEKFRETRREMEQAQLDQVREREQRMEAEKQAAEREHQLVLEKMQKEEQERQVNTEKRERLERICLEFEQTMSDVLTHVRSASVEMEGAAREMFSLADANSEKTEALAAASEQSTQNMSSVSSSASDLMATVDQISDRVVESAKGTSGAVEEIERANVHIQQLEDASQKIGDVISLINDIAEQTNLLALNATIEAARAGDAGRGFAVVASEVKNLAGQTAEATDEIASQVSGMRAATVEAVRTMRMIGDTIKTISRTSEEIATSVQGQEEATRGIVKSVQEVSGGMNGIQENVVSVSQGTQDTSRVANDVLTNANRLNRESEKLTQRFDRFLADIKAVS
ncbi:methyl-accepting chemotaxis protein [Emcibacter sp.]|uniref:methyl-accepting chemotaxis protein n=1 Tax=Emcibacter sp. TaxID=1979954 RepID=UPI002AA71824|nr:methyl-accepting chemotaxis protein [Emcibacter sp.]